MELLQLIVDVICQARLSIVLFIGVVPFVVVLLVLAMLSYVHCVMVRPVIGQNHRKMQSHRKINVG